VSVAGCLQGSDLWRENEPSNASAGGTKTETGTPLPEEFENRAYAERFSREGSWPVPGYDAGRTAYNPSTDLPQGETAAAWLRWLDGNGPFARPVTDGQHLYQGTEQKAMPLLLLSGRKRASEYGPKLFPQLTSQILRETPRRPK
jgi:hypothetical protein